MSPKQYIQRYDKEKETLLISFRNPQLQFVSVSFKFVHPCLYILYDLLCYFFLVFNRWRCFMFWALFLRFQINFVKSVLLELLHDGCSSNWTSINHMNWYSFSWIKDGWPSAYLLSLVYTVVVPIMAYTPAIWMDRDFISWSTVNSLKDGNAVRDGATVPVTEESGLKRVDANVIPVS